MVIPVSVLRSLLTAPLWPLMLWPSSVHLCPSLSPHLFSLLSSNSSSTSLHCPGPPMSNNSLSSVLYNLSFFLLVLLGPTIHHLLFFTRFLTFHSTSYSYWKTPSPSLSTNSNSNYNPLYIFFPLFMLLWGPYIAYGKVECGKGWHQYKTYLWTIILALYYKMLNKKN